jgi:hypothetical protein
MADICESGVFFDTKNQKVVDSKPEEGIQIVAPGDEMTADREADIQRWRDVEIGTPAPVAEAVTTEAASGGEPAEKSARAARTNK